MLPARPPCTLSLADLQPITLQAEIAAIQKEKERIVTTTIDDELAADPKLAAVRRGASAGGWDGAVPASHWLLWWFVATYSPPTTHASCAPRVTPAATALAAAACHRLLQEVDAEIEKEHFMVVP